MQPDKAMRNKDAGHWRDYGFSFQSFWYFIARIFYSGLFIDIYGNVTTFERTDIYSHLWLIKGPLLSRAIGVITKLYQKVIKGYFVSIDFYIILIDLLKLLTLSVQNVLSYRRPVKHQKLNKFSN